MRPCECSIEYGHGHDSDYIDFCPLHAAAPALKEALMGILKWLDHVKEEGNAPTEFRIGAKSCAGKARAAIAQAKGQ